MFEQQQHIADSTCTPQLHQLLLQPQCFFIADPPKIQVLNCHSSILGLRLTSHLREINPVIWYGFITVWLSCSSIYQMSAPQTRWRISIAYSSLLCVLVFILVTSGYLHLWSVLAEEKPHRSTPKPSVAGKAPAATDGYVGADACADCHEQIYNSFERTRMGRSMTLVTPALLKTLTLPGSFYNQALDRHFEVFARNDKLYQSEFAVGPDGKEIFRDTKQIEWIVGAGANGLGGLVTEGGALFQAPLSFYTRSNRWEPSPGYENYDLGFHRPVLPGCIVCHSGRPNLLDQKTSHFDGKPFLQTAIGCENCHGPGAAHVRAEVTHQGLDSGPQIVNPARLSADLENNICMSCHEAADSRVPRPGKAYQDFRPGQPLDNAVSVFMVPLKPTDPDNEDHVQHFFEMSMSKCYRATADNSAAPLATIRMSSRRGTRRRPTSMQNA